MSDADDIQVEVAAHHLIELARPPSARRVAHQRRGLASALQQAPWIAAAAEDLRSSPRCRRMVLGQAEGQHVLDRLERIVVTDLPGRVDARATNSGK